MYKNNNDNVIKELARSHLLQSKSRLIVVVIAVSLTALLITSISTIGFNMLQAEKLFNQQLLGTKAHCEIYIKNEEESKKIKENKLVKEYGEYKNIGEVKNLLNEDLDRRITTLTFMDDIVIKNKFYKDSLVGELPKKNNEILIDNLVFDSIGKKFKIGDNINIKYSDINNKLLEKEFKITGYYTGNRVENYSDFIVSKKFFENKLEEFVIELTLKNSFHIENNVKKILNESGLDNKSNRYTIHNSNDILLKESIEVVLATLLLVIVIVINGYLIIYNIFYISIIRETRFYGLIKTIGITSKQIRKMIFYESMILSFIGISIGLFSGLGFGYLLFKKVYSVNDYNLEYFNFSISSLMIIVAVMFSLLTVLISTYKPLKIASKVSAIEAAKYTGNYKKNHKKTSDKYGSKIWYMAYSNIKSNKIKSILVVVSLSLSIIMVNIVYSLTKSFDIDEYVSSKMISDYSIGDSSYYNYQYDENSKNSLTEKLCDEFKNMEGVKDFSKVYNFLYSGNGYKDLRNRLYEGCKRTLKEDNITYDINKSEFEKIYIQVYGIDNFAYNYLLDSDGDSEDLKALFNTGKYVIAEKNSFTGKILKKDEIIKLEYPNKKIKNYKVLYTTNNVPRSLKRLHFSISSLSLYLPKDEFLINDENANVMTALFNVEKSKNKYIEKFLESKVREIYNFDYKSANSYKKEFSNFKNVTMILGYSLSFIIGLIGILNFINLICTNIFSRKYELSIMQSIGMTKKQLKKMLSLEGIYHSIIVTFFVITLGRLISYIVMKIFESNIDFTYFSKLPILGMLLILFLFSSFLPKLIYKTVEKENLIERIKYID